MDEMKRRMAEAKAANAAKMAKVNGTPCLCGPDQTAAFFWGLRTKSVFFSSLFDSWLTNAHALARRSKRSKRLRQNQRLHRGPRHKSRQQALL